MGGRNQSISTQYLALEKDEVKEHANQYKLKMYEL